MLPNDLPIDTDAVPPLIPTDPSLIGSLYLSKGKVYIQPARLKNVPTPADRRLGLTDNQQTFNDSRTIVGWTNLIHKLITKAFTKADGTIDVQFTQDYDLLGKDPSNLSGAIIVHQILSKVPALVGSYREIKPRIREVIDRQAVSITTSASGASTIVQQPAEDGSQYVWAQSFDVIMSFTVYGATWAKMYEWLQKFEDFMTTYSGVFIQTGLQQFTFREETRDALFDPPRTEEFPNKSLYYNVRVERQTKVNYAEIEEILIAAGLIDPLTGTPGQTQLLGVTTGVPESPVLPASPS